MRHSSCWFPLITALREHPSPSPCCHTHTVTRSLIGTWMRSHKQHRKALSANPCCSFLESSSTWASRRVSGMWQRSRCAQFDDHQTCQKAANQLLPALIRLVEATFRAAGPQTPVMQLQLSNICFLCEDFLLNDGPDRVQLVWTVWKCVLAPNRIWPVIYLQTRAKATQWVSSECMLQLIKEVKWASQIHSYSTHSPAMTASVATGTFPIHIHNNSKAHSRWPSRAACLPSGHRRQLCALTHVNLRTQIQTLADTVVTVVMDRGALTYLLMIFRSRLKSIFNVAPRRLRRGAERYTSPRVLVDATWCGSF